jgi:hypothetical protein
MYLIRTNKVGRFLFLHLRKIHFHSFIRYSINQVVILCDNELYVLTILLLLLL